MEEDGREGNLIHLNFARFEGISIRSRRDIYIRDLEKAWTIEIRHGTILEEYRLVELLTNRWTEIGETRVTGPAPGKGKNFHKLSRSLSLRSPSPFSPAFTHS